MFRQSIWGCCRLVMMLSSVACVAGSFPTFGAAFSVAPGFLYAPSDLTAQQFSPLPELVGTGGPGNFLGSSGAAISQDGLFLYEAYRRNAGGADGAHLLALGNGGTIVHELPLTNIGLNRASGIAVDGGGWIYAAAADGLHQISPDFSKNTVLPVSFRRASGVAVAPNGFLYVADQDANVIRILDNNRQAIATTISTGPVPSGVTFGPDGFLYYTDTPFHTPTTDLGRLVRVEPVSLQQTVVFGDLPSPMDVEFAPDGSYYLATSGSRIDHYSASNVLLHSYSGSAFMDQLVYYVPEPGSASIMASLACATALGRRRQAARSR
jgi:sugar lactone lactonase YvrE